MPDSSSSLSVLMVAAQLKDYLSARPGASDDLEGVMGWWNQSRGPGMTREQIQAALDDLVLRGAVRTTTGGDGRRRYTLATAARDDHDRR